MLALEGTIKMLKMKIIGRDLVKQTKGFLLVNNHDVWVCLFLAVLE